MSNQLWGRKYKISVVDNKTGQGWDVSTLRCTFHIEKTKTITPNMSEVVIYNLNAQTESQIIKEGNRLIVEAGYEGYIQQDKPNASGKVVNVPSQYGVIFDGWIVQIRRIRQDNLNYELHISALDGDFIVSYNWIIDSHAKNSKPRDIVNATAANSRNPIAIGQITDNLSTQQLPRGKVIFAEPKEVLRAIAYSNNADFWEEDNKIYMMQSGDVPFGSAIEVSPQTGQIGWAEQVEYGIRFKTLINSKFKIYADVDLYTYIQIDNTNINLTKQTYGQLQTELEPSGSYKIYKVIHTGDTRGNEWYTTVEATTENGKLGFPTLTSGQTPLGPR